MWTILNLKLLRAQQCLLLLLMCCCSATEAFVTPSSSALRLSQPSAFSSTAPATIRPTRSGAMSTTSLNLLIETNPHFFATTFLMLGILLDVSRSFSRLRMEERAWEQRVEEARMKRLQDDPTVTELELRRKEAAMEWSAYGKPRQEEEALERQFRKEEEARYGKRRRGVKLMDDDEDFDDEEEMEFRSNRMSDEDINSFELEYGIEYDPYYDDPYTEEELPEDIDFKVDKKYGDRIYSNGEIFYKDKASGLYYRQGAKPRSLSFW